MYRYLKCLLVSMNYGVWTRTMKSTITKSSKKRDKRQVNKGLRKRQDWDDKAHHDAPSAIYFAVTK